MQVTETLRDGLKRGWTVVLPASDIAGKRNARLSELGKTLRLPGFRPGKVPPNLIRQRYGTAVTAEILETSVQDATRQVLDERGLRPALQPKVDVVSADPDRDLEFKIEAELLPEITPPDFSGIQLTRLKAEPSDEAVDKALLNIAGRNRELVDVAEDRGAQTGDVLKVDFVGKRDGEPFPGGSATDMDVEIGGSGFIPGFAEQLEGIRPGEARTIQVTFPAEYHAADLAGQPAQFEVTAKALRTAKPQEMDDSFAEKLGMESMDELRQTIRGVIQREYDGLSRMRLKRELLDRLAGLATFEVPPGMVEAEFNQIWQRVEADRKSGQADEEDKAKSDDELRTEYRTIAERRVRLGLLLSEIGRTNGVQVGQEELNRAMRVEAGRYPGQERQVMELFRNNPQAMESLRGPLFEEKVVDFILELAKVEDRTVTAEELAAEPPAGPSTSEGASAEAAAS